MLLLLLLVQICLVLATTGLATEYTEGIGAAQSNSVQQPPKVGPTLQPNVGYPHGDAFDDGSTILLNGRKRIYQIVLAGCGPGEHFSGMTITFRAEIDRSDNPRAIATVQHGTYTGSADQPVLTLIPSAYISKVGMTTWRKKVSAFKRKTRLGWISISTSDGKGIECGSKSGGDPYYSYPDPMDTAALLYFSGSAGDAIDSLDTHFVPLDSYFPKQ